MAMVVVMTMMVVVMMVLAMREAVATHANKPLETFPTLLRWVLVLNRAAARASSPSRPLLSFSLLPLTSVRLAWSLASYLVAPGWGRFAKLSPLSRAAGEFSGVKHHPDSD